MNLMKLVGYIILLVALSTIFSNCILNQNDADEYNSQGLMYLNEAKYMEALIEFKRAYKAENGNWEKKVMHLRNISIAYEGLNDLESVRQTQKAALKLCPGNSYEHFVTKGDIALMDENTQNAIDNYIKAIKINPNKLEANNSLGLIYIGDYGFDFADYQKALKYNHKALELYPYSITKNVLGRNYFLLENYEKADQYFSEILEEYPNDLEAKYSLGIIKYYLEDYKSAKELLSEVVKYNPEAFEYDEEILKELDIEF